MINKNPSFKLKRKDQLTQAMHQVNQTKVKEAELIESLKPFTYNPEKNISLIHKLTKNINS